MFKKKNNSLGLRSLFRRRTKDEDSNSRRSKKGGADTTISPTKTELTADSHHVRGIDLETFDAALDNLPDHSPGILSVLSSTSLDDSGHHLRSLVCPRRTRSEAGLDAHSEGDPDKYFVRANSDVSTDTSAGALTQWISNVPKDRSTFAIRSAVDSDDESLGSIELLLEHMCGGTVRDDLSVSEHEPFEQAPLPLTKPKKQSIILSVMNGMCGA